MCFSLWLLPCSFHTLVAICLLQCCTSLGESRSGVFFLTCFSVFLLGLELAHRVYCFWTGVLAVVFYTYFLSTKVCKVWISLSNSFILLIHFSVWLDIIYQLFKVLTFSHKGHCLVLRRKWPTQRLREHSSSAFGTNSTLRKCHKPLSARAHIFHDKLYYTTHWVEMTPFSNIATTHCDYSILPWPAHSSGESPCCFNILGVHMP